MVPQEAKADSAAVQAKKERILEVIFQITQTVLERHSHYEVIPDALAAIGGAVDADRVYYWENRTDERNGQELTSQVFEWCRPGISQQVDNSDLRDLPFDIVFDFLEPLKRGFEQSIIVSELEPSFSRKLLLNQEILSLLALPVFVNQNFWGFVGFDDCTKEKSWSELEISLLKSFVAILSRSIERNLLEESLIRTKHQAESASRAKSQFLSSVSHELRTPLNAIMFYTELLKETTVHGDQKGKIDQIASSAEMLLLLINNLLDYSKLESGKAQLVPGDFSLEDIVNQAINQSLAAAKDNNIVISCEIDNNLPLKLCGDSLKISQILLNLIDNALKFTLQGEVKIKVQLLEETGNDIIAVFSITDTGIGMTEDQSSNVFEPFMQASPEIAASYGGTGLGLAICRNLAELHGGDIWLESEKDKGTTVNFTALFRKKCPRKAQQWSAETHNAKEKQISDKPELQLQGISILAIEDNEINRKVLELMFSKTMAHLAIADSGQEALKLAEKKRYDIILTDVIMPDLDGYETTDLLRALPGYYSTPVIAVTAGDPNLETAKCEAHNIDALLIKPLQKHELFTQISNLLKASADNEQENSVNYDKYAELTRRLSEANVDYLEALERFGQDWIFYCELLKQFYHDYHEFSDDLSAKDYQETVKSDNMCFLHKIHSLKGSAAELGAVDLAQEAALLEKAIRQNKSFHPPEKTDTPLIYLRQQLRKLLYAAACCI